MAFWSETGRARQGNAFGSDDLQSPNLEVGQEFRTWISGVCAPPYNLVGFNYFLLGKAITMRLARIGIAVLVLFGMFTIALAFTSSNHVLNISSITPVETRRDSGWRLEFALKRQPFFEVKADWSTEATVLSDDGKICPEDPRYSFGTSVYETTGGYVRHIPAEWLRPCLDDGPVELRSQWQVRYSFWIFNLRMKPHTITQVVSWDTVKEGADS